MALIFDGGEQHMNSYQYSEEETVASAPNNNSAPGPNNNNVSNSAPNNKKNGEKGESVLESVTKKFLSDLFTLQELYRIAVKFYREKENKAFHVSFDDRTKLFAYTKLVKYGIYRDFEAKHSTNADAGFFDWTGNSLKDCWEDLGDTTKDEAMARFIFLLDSICPQFSPFVEAQKRKLEEQKRSEMMDEEFRQRADAHRVQIQAALNRQTYQQFSAYALQQYPGDVEQQKLLIKQLQEQHYQQYMAEIYEQHVKQQNSHIRNYTAVANNNSHAISAAANNIADLHTIADNSTRSANNNVKDMIPDNSNSSSGGESGDENDEPSNPAITPASMWTRKDIKDFKETIKKESPESVIKVSHGETVLVRVPTHEDGSCLFWEFATDDYDIGFGISFEWTVADSNTVTVHISESDDEDEDEIHNEEKKGDVEEGASNKDKQTCKPLTDEIVPVYRRDCHDEVYAGSHIYPGRGVYLLKFDNSYSLWRSKRLYYRVYYSK